MSIEQNTAILRRWLEDVINEGRLEQVSEVVDPDWRSHDALLPPLTGIEGARQLAEMFRTGLADLRVSTEDLVAQGDRVAARLRLRGIHRGRLFGIARTGNPIDVGALGIFRIARGKLAESWVTVDALSLLRQLGALPRAETAPA